MKAASTADQPRQPADAPAAVDQKEARLAPQLRAMFQVYLGSHQRNKIIWLGVALVLVIGATAFAQIKLNAWNRPFYDALARKDLRDFLSQLVFFCIIAGALLVLNVGQAWINQATRVLLREGLVRDLFREWLKPRRAFRLGNAGEIGSNPDQRMHEDARHLTELSADLGIGLLQSSLLLGSFIGVLWMLSAEVVFHLGGRRFGVPGYMVWCALIYAGTASWLSWLVGHPLVELNNKRYAQEAELRYALVRLNEHVDTVSLYGGEEDERRHLNSELGKVLHIMWRIVNAATRLTWITAGYGWSTIVVPIVIAAPGYFGGDLSFGELMMTVGAFMQVQQSLRWFIDNFSMIADWRATLLRIASFRETVVTMDKLGATENRIEFVETGDSKLSFENLEVATPSGCTMLSEPHVEIQQGDRVLIIGDPGTGKTILFRAIAGLWPFGSGRVSLPSADGIMFIPREPYVPLGTLRGGLAYPSPESTFKDEQLVAVLKGAGLERLSSSLDQVARWDRELSEDEQQYLVFARLLLHQPRWAVIDEALDALDEDARRRFINLFQDKLKDTAIINIGRDDTEGHFFTRVLHLVKDPLQRCSIPARRPAFAKPVSSSVRPSIK